MTLKSSFPPVVAPDTRVLVLGSLPGDRSLAARQYYAHPQNQFWRLMSAVIERDLVLLSYTDRIDALSAARIGLWDVVASAHRPGSTDAAITAAAANDIATLAASLPHLRAIAFNGGTARKHGQRLLGPHPAHAILTLPSSSPLHTIGFEAKRPAWLALRTHLQ